MKGFMVILALLCAVPAFADCPCPEKLSAPIKVKKHERPRIHYQPNAEKGQKCSIVPVVTALVVGGTLFAILNRDHDHDRVIYVTAPKDPCKD